MIRVASIYNESIVDGEGYRTAIFLQGCSHHCKGCHNPESWDFNGGKEMTTEEVLDGFDINTSDGITLSGGDPFFQAKELKDLLKYCKKNKVSVWAYTGFKFEEFLKFINNEECDKRITSDMINMLKYVDITVDGPFIIEKRSLDILYRGSTNQRLVDTKKSLKAKRIIEYSPEG